MKDASHPLELAGVRSGKHGELLEVRGGGLIQTGGLGHLLEEVMWLDLQDE